MKILDDVLDTLKEDASAQEVRIGPYWTAVWSRQCGLASTLGAGEHEHGTVTVGDAGTLTGGSTLELAALAHSESLLEASIGMAAVNSLLEVDEERCVELNARDLLIERGTGKRMALVGHFPFVPELRQAVGHLWVLEIRPRPGDLPAEEAAQIIPQADIVAITGSSFINHTIDRLLSYRRPDAFVTVLGPTTPLSPVLFDHGVDVISGTRVVEPEVALRYVSEGASFRQMQGVSLLTMKR